MPILFFDKPCFVPDCCFDCCSILVLVLCMHQTIDGGPTNNNPLSTIRYTEGGFRVSPWLELLDMGKWVVPSNALPLPAAAAAPAAGTVGGASE